MTTDPVSEFERLVKEHNEKQTMRYAEGPIAWERKTCEAVPTQWEGELRDGRLFYFRYRWGGASLGLGWTHNEAVGDPNTVGVAIGNSLDGYMDDVEYRRVRDQLLKEKGL